MVKNMSSESLRHHAVREEKRSPSHSLHSRHHSNRHKARKVVTQRSDCHRTSLDDLYEHSHSSRRHRSSKSYAEKFLQESDALSKATLASSGQEKSEKNESPNQCDMTSEKCSSILGFDVTKDEETSELLLYLNDPEGLMRLAFEAVTYGEVKKILPTSLKTLDLKQLFELCVEEVKALSKSQIVTILEEEESNESSESFSIDAVLSDISRNAFQRKDLKLRKIDSSRKNEVEVCKRKSPGFESEQSSSGEDVKEVNNDNAQEGYISLEDDYFDAPSSSGLADVGHYTA